MIRLFRRRTPRGIPRGLPTSGVQVINGRLPDGYVPPSTSLRPGDIPVTLPGPDFGNPGTPQSVVVRPELAPIGILDGPLTPGATIALRTPEQARTAIRDAILRHLRVGEQRTGSGTRLLGPRRRRTQGERR